MNINIKEILAREPKAIIGRNKKVYDYSDVSNAFNFYDEQFDDIRRFDIGSAIKNESLQKSPKEMIDLMSFLQKNLDPYSIVVELGGSRHQRRSGYPYYFFDNYFPLDLSRSSMLAYSELYDRVGIACNAQKLPFKDKTIDALYTHTFLEHPLNPNDVTKEIDRVLKFGGIVIHSDAWHCRWWKRFGIYGEKNYAELNHKEKFLYVIIFLSEIKAIRIPVIIIKRLLKEFFIDKSSPVNLIYRKLIPNYELKIYSDEDAAANIDPLDLVRFYESRGYKQIPQKTFLQRIFLNDKNLYFKKYSLEE